MILPLAGRVLGAGNFAVNIRHAFRKANSVIALTGRLMLGAAVFQFDPQQFSEQTRSQGAGHSVQIIFEKRRVAGSPGVVKFRAQLLDP